jgi:hypothetical protein
MGTIANTTTKRSHFYGQVEWDDTKQKYYNAEEMLKLRSSLKIKSDDKSTNHKAHYSKLQYSKSIYLIKQVAITQL